MLEVRDVHVYYGKTRALAGVDLEVGEGEVVAVVGRNGAGKTTLIKAIMGIVEPTRGTIRFMGRDVTKTPPWERARMGLGYVPEGRRLFPYLTVEENLILGGYNIRDRRELQERLEEVYALFPRLKERRRQLARTLSGGEAQMLAIARALVAKPRLLLMDEPSQGLAPVIVDEIFRKIAELKEAGQAILLVEQNVKKALEVADRVYVLDMGRVVYSAPAEQAASDPVIRKIYLGR
jgi:branched-chain amino acid transport system ATP-binding protein